MKKLSLLIFAILILGCGTETPVVEEPEPVVEEPPPVAMEEEPIAPPQIVGGNVLDGDVDADPDVLNRDGIIIEFSEPLHFFLIEIFLKLKNLGWHPRDVVAQAGLGVGKSATIKPMAGSQLLEYNTKYVIEIYIQNLACHGVAHTIQFRTKPR